MKLTKDAIKNKYIKEGYHSGFVEGYKSLAFEVLMDIENGLSIKDLQEKLKDIIEP